MIVKLLYFLPIPPDEFSVSTNNLDQMFKFLIFLVLCAGAAAFLTRLVSFFRDF